MADTNTTTEQGWFVKPTIDTITYFENLGASFYENVNVMVDTTYVKLSWMDAKGQALNVIIPFTQAANGQKEWNEAIANGTGSVIQDLVVNTALTAGYLVFTGAAVLSTPAVLGIGAIALGVTWYSAAENKSLGNVFESAVRDFNNDEIGALDYLKESFLNNPTIVPNSGDTLITYDTYSSTGIKTSTAISAYSPLGQKTSTTVSTYNPDGTSAGVVKQALPTASDLITVPDTSSRSWVMDLFDQAAGATTFAIDKSVEGTSFERSTLQDLGTTAPSTSNPTPSYTLPFVPNNFFQNQDPNYGFIPGNNGGPSDYPGYYGGGGYVFPVILDLDGDGVEMVSMNDSRAWFDVTGDGTLHKTGWVGADDALLAFDENGDGKITTASEVMFASRTAITTDTDLEAIATEFDTNYDGILDASDAQFEKFRVWKDSNGNGETDAGELKTLTEMGMNSVNLVSTKVAVEIDGNKVAGFATYTKSDGTIGSVGDVGFGYDPVGYTTTLKDGYTLLTATGDVAKNYAIGMQTALNLSLVDASLDGAFGGSLDDVLNATGKTTSTILDGGAGNDTLSGGSGADRIRGGIGSDVLNGGAGDDIVIMDAGDVISNITGGAGFDTLLMEGSTAISMDLSARGFEAAVGNDGNDSFSTSGNSGVVLLGKGGNDTLTGSISGDLIEGGVGNDILNGRGGNDIYRFNKGDGVDTINEYETRNEAYTVIEWRYTYKLGVDPSTGQFYYYVQRVPMPITRTRTIEVNNGNDTIQMGAGIGVGDIVITYFESDLIIAIKEEGVTDINLLSDRIIVKNYNNSNSAIERIEFEDGTVASFSSWISGTNSNDTLQGTNGNDVLSGDGGNDTLIGLAGDDILDGGEGVDTMYGGTGNDTYIVDNINDVLIEKLNEGTDTVKSSVTYSLSEHIENLLLTGEGAIDGIGNTLNNIITGNFAQNKLNGGLGEDTLIGGAGNDLYIIDNVKDIIVEGENKGIDTVIAAFNYTLGENLDNLLLSGNTSLVGRGNNLDNTIIGNDNNNTLDGGSGVDTLIGGKGDDIYSIDNINDAITENLNEGIDSVHSNISYVLRGNLENLTLTGTSVIDATGNALDNILTGNSGNNTLDGGMGADILIGGAGDDLYMIDQESDTIVENTNEGNDIVQSSITYTLNANVENLILTGAIAIDGYGNGANNSISGNSSNNMLNGGDGDDVLDGAEGDDHLFGGAGNDILFGSEGHDLLAGGLGDDTYAITNEGDTIIENLNEGIDSIQSSVTYTLGANLDNLILTETAADGMGNELNNILIGNDNNNMLDGGSGVDMLIGGQGNDLYIVDNLNDAITENLNEGNDTVQSSVTYTLANNLENLTLTGTAAINGTGNTLDNILTGNSAVNILSGGAGNDTYIVDSTADFIVENANEGNDIVQSSVTYTLGGNFENLILTGSAEINGAGNSLNNTLIGNNGKNILDGGSGADILKGGSGNDTYYVDNVGDIVFELDSEGIDIVQSSVTYTLGDNIENLALVGSSNIHAIGNSSNNILTGNSGYNMLAGKEGDDTYILTSLDDFIVEKLNEGTDTVQSSTTYALANNLENLILVGTANLEGSGNSANNILIGNLGLNVLRAGAGDDIIFGGSGDDYLYGDEGNDILNGDEGNDHFYDMTGDNILNGGSGNDSLYSGIGKDILNGDEGNDWLLSGAGDDIVNGGIGNDDLVGEDGSDILNGGDGDDHLQGDKWLSDIWGNDVLNGGAGNDSLLGFGGDDVLNGGEGDDYLQGDQWLSDMWGNDVLNGDEGDDCLCGNVGDDELNGGSENDFLDGGIGNDTLNGGINSDALAGDGGNDTYYFNRGDGDDMVFDFIFDENHEYNYDNFDDPYYSILDSGNDTIQFGSSVVINDIAFFKQGNDLVLSYGDNDLISIINQSVVNNAIEKFTLADGNFLTSNDLNVIIQSMNAYATDHGMSITSLDTVKANQDLMNIVAGAWHQ